MMSLGVSVNGKRQLSKSCAVGSNPTTPASLVGITICPNSSIFYSSVYEFNVITRFQDKKGCAYA